MAMSSPDSWSAGVGVGAVLGLVSVVLDVARDDAGTVEEAMENIYQ